jgi:hypothetical protein
MVTLQDVILAAVKGVLDVDVFLAALKRSGKRSSEELGPPESKKRCGPLRGA